jgi:ring-1,2-phenylacetyl-CoA epoxidase subunit PaaC
MPDETAVPHDAAQHESALPDGLDALQSVADDVVHQPSHPAPDPNDAHGSVYDGLLGGDPSHWAFGTDFEDPLAGVDTTMPNGVEAADLGAYCLMLADDALIASQRLSEWCSRAPDLEDDIALSNVALDLLGQARLLLARAAAADPSLVPALPDGSPVPPEDALAFFRDAGQFRNVRLVELDNGDFAVTIVKLLLHSSARIAIFERLVESRDHVLAAVAAKGVKELTYHRDYAGRWFLTLARGTQESRRRLDAALATVWPLNAEMFRTHEVEARVAAAGVGVDPATVADDVAVVLAQVFALSGVDQPTKAPLAAVQGRQGRDGMHTEALSRIVGEMQVVARAHPMGQW